MTSSLPPQLTVIVDDETRSAQYERDWTRYQRCSLVPEWVECGDMSYVLDMTPPKDVFIQTNMIGHFVFVATGLLANQKWF